MKRNRFESFCYIKASDRKKVREISKYTASLFYEADHLFIGSCPENITAYSRSIIIAQHVYCVFIHGIF
jgi:hypothetical protein